MSTSTAKWRGIRLRSITRRISDSAVIGDYDTITKTLERAIALGGFAATQMKAGGLEKADQFEVVDDRSVRVKFLRKSKLTLPDLAVPVPFIINSKIAKSKATPQDHARSR